MPVTALLIEAAERISSCLRGSSNSRPPGRDEFVWLFLRGLQSAKV